MGGCGEGGGGRLHFLFSFQMVVGNHGYPRRNSKTHSFSCQRPGPKSDGAEVVNLFFFKAIEVGLNLLYLYFISVFPAFLSVYRMCAWRPRNHNRVSDPLKLDGCELPRGSGN